MCSENQEIAASAITFTCNSMAVIASDLVLFRASLGDLFIGSPPDDRKMMQCIPLPLEKLSHELSPSFQSQNESRWGGKVLLICAAVQGPISVTLWDLMT